MHPRLAPVINCLAYAVFQWLTLEDDATGTQIPLSKSVAGDFREPLGD
jgi:hypothetical protein